MGTIKYGLILFLLTGSILACTEKEVLPPAAVLPVPTQAQLDWQEKELFAFIHFTVNTFTGKEWGYGDEDPNVFNPAGLDPSQWAKVLKEAGFKGAILTAKHHDGFCLWPSKFTEHSVKNSSWRAGKGDVVGELKKACDEHALEFGIYLSPWDRNHAGYGTASYIQYYRDQLNELLEGYGPIFEIWFDGANGGDGYYGGARENRKIDDQVYYQWDETFKIVKDHNPRTIIRGDARNQSTDSRWCGNEKGYVGKTNWNPVSPDSLLAYGKDKSRVNYLNQGDKNGHIWMPAEVDVSIRPGWFYHQHEDSLVKTPQQLFDIYLNSAGRGAPLLLNVTPDKRGLIPDEDINALKGFRKLIDEAFANNLAPTASVSADSYRGNSDEFAAENLTDKDSHTYYATDDSIKTASIRFDFNKPRQIRYVVLREYLPLGQRVKSFDIEILKDGNWKQVADETTIGYKRILRFNPMETVGLRVNITGSKACPVLSNIEIY
ncbi:MAG: alpha-L-fucosidase [Prolixibacteraceae bacterium]